MNKTAIINELYGEGYFPTKKAAGECLDFILDTITDSVAEGTDVRIAGFGKFEKYERTNGAHTPKFRPAKAFKTRVG